MPYNTIRDTWGVDVSEILFVEESGFLFLFYKVKYLTVFHLTFLTAIPHFVFIVRHICEKRKLEHLCMSICDISAYRIMFGRVLFGKGGDQLSVKPSFSTISQLIGLNCTENVSSFADCAIRMKFCEIICEF